MGIEKIYEHILSFNVTDQFLKYHLEIPSYSSATSYAFFYSFKPYYVPLLKL